MAGTSSRTRTRTKTRTRTRIIVFTICALTLLCAVAVPLLVVVAVRSRCSPDTFSRAAVAADSHICSQIGRDILQQGGSAVDGAIAALLCTTLVNPQSMGLGGGAIFTVMDNNGRVAVINARETVPEKTRSDLLRSCPSRFQLLSGTQWIAVPGELRGYEQAHRLYGKLPWATLFQPAIRLAREGFPVPKVQGGYIPFTDTNQSRALRKLFSDKDGNLLKTGDTVRFEKLADTFQTIANHGADVFYTGSVARDLIHDIQEAGGTLTLQDLAQYRAKVSEPWKISLGEYQMYIPPPPAGGIVLSLVLNILKGFGLTLAAEHQTLTYHRYVEALKFANGLKKDLHPRLTTEAMGRKLTEDDFADRIRTLILSDRTHEPQFYNISHHLDTVGTTHLSVLAEDGSAVSVTSSINHIFGSRVFSPRTGVILNNQLSDFCGRVEEIFPGDQPPSSMTPALLKSPTRTLVIGGTGGSMITTAMASAVMHHIWFGKGLRESIAAPVIFVDAKNDLWFEANFDKNLTEALMALGHRQDPEAHRFFNVVNAVEKQEDGCICAVSDSRKLGRAAGY
ncbi:gamma-glutamyltransferase 5a [Cynoglossus semilaevis]|uniref:Glutathione hydrolase n=1 Tax=Cynoglossus semilaevis TaxID=244447 RepID=A0A3P8WNC7_CYNSE|nr:glutathione hydrolase 5 proenzyme-like [Cynoglossus semilaevis]